jgi:DNA-binding XRE family transcriptional regulator
MTMPWVPGVYVILDYSEWAYEPLPSNYEPSWCAWLVSEAVSRDPDLNPEFPTAREAVEWWREQGFNRIFVSFDPHFEDRTWEWAGVGDPPANPDTGQALNTFSLDDLRGEPEGARAIAQVKLDLFQQDMRDLFAQRDRAIGERLRARRDALDLSVDVVADRIGVEPASIVEIEEGATSGPTPLTRWVDLVWATRTPWPDQRRELLQGVDQVRGWTNVDPLTLAERMVAEVTDETGDAT